MMIARSIWNRKTGSSQEQWAFAACLYGYACMSKKRSIEKYKYFWQQNIQDCNTYISMTWLVPLYGKNLWFTSEKGQHKFMMIEFIDITTKRLWCKMSWIEGSGLKSTSIRWYVTMKIVNTVVPIIFSSIISTSSYRVMFDLCDKWLWDTITANIPNDFRVRSSHFYHNRASNQMQCRKLNYLPLGLAEY